MLIQLKTAKYKKVEFLFTDTSTVFGNRIIKINFPGSDKQSIEPQGKIPPIFDITIVIPFENYYSQKDNLLRILQDGERGVFTHPNFGDIENVINGECRINETTNRLGRAEISVVFEVDDSPGIPQQSGNLASQVQTQSDILNTQIVADLGKGFVVDSIFPRNFTDAIDVLNNVTDAFNAAGQLSDTLIENLSSYRATVDKFSSNIGNLISVPEELSTSIADLFESLNNLYDIPDDLLNAFKSLFPFGDDDPEINTSTVGKAQRERNRDLIRSNMRCQSLSFAYVNAASSTFSTTEDVDKLQDDLEEQYKDLIKNQILSDEALEELHRLRVQAQKSLDLVRVNARSIITIETPLIPLTILVFNFYGSTDLVDAIADLNSIKQNAFVKGEIRILTE